MTARTHLYPLKVLQWAVAQGTVLARSIFTTSIASYWLNLVLSSADLLCSIPPPVLRILDSYYLNHSGSSERCLLGPSLFTYAFANGITTVVLADLNVAFTYPASPFHFACPVKLGYQQAILRFSHQKEPEHKVLDDSKIPAAMAIGIASCMNPI